MKTGLAFHEDAEKALCHRGVDGHLLGFDAGLFMLLLGHVRLQRNSINNSVSGSRFSVAGPSSCLIIQFECITVL